MNIQEHAQKRIRDNNKKLGPFTIAKKKKVCTKKNMLEELADFHAYALNGIGINYKKDREVEIIMLAGGLVADAYGLIDLLKK